MTRVIIGLAVLIFGSTGVKSAITHGMKGTESRRVCGRGRCFSFWEGAAQRMVLGGVP